ncbi:MAG: histidinol-phosphatase [Eubacterium sp.]|nr:histidinol-phosphatase [Eubacterium sp.]
MNNFTLIAPEGDINLHTHTYYCDGLDSPREMAEKAVSLGLKVLGFSGHGYAPYDLDCCMTEENEAVYVREIMELKKEFAGQLDIRLGVEHDCLSGRGYFGKDAPGGKPFDYSIGSVHYIEVDGEILCIDAGSALLERICEEHFRGDFRSLVEKYYETAARVVELTGADIVGHFDLITKFNSGSRYFSEQSPWYRELSAAAALKAFGTLREPHAGIVDIIGRDPHPVFEINTGAMAKGLRDVPYPSEFLVSYLAEKGARFVLSSDCHNKAFLRYGFDRFIR